MKPILPLLLVLAACGDDGAAPLADAPPSSDALPDSQEPPPPQAVSVTITAGDDPIPGVTVYFQDADLSVVAALETDAGGVAAAELAAGGFVTAIDPFGGDNGGRLPELRTIAGVKPGDQLRMHRRVTPPAISIAVAYPEITGGFTYLLFTTCSGARYDVSSGPVPFTLPSCTHGDFLVEAFDRGGASLGSVSRANVVVTDGMMLDLTGEAYAAPVTTTYTYANPPPNFREATFQPLAMTPRGVAHFVDADTLVMPGASTRSRPVPPGAVAVAASVFEATVDRGIHLVLDWGAPATTYTLDVTAALLPRYSADPTFDVATRTVTWEGAAIGPSEPDFVEATVGVVDVAGNRSWVWSVVAPYAGRSVTLPALPGDDGAAWNPTAGHAITVRGLTTATSAGGYDGMRARWYTSTGFEHLVVGASGRAVVQVLRAR